MRWLKIPISTLIIVPLSQIKKRGDEYYPAKHTELKLRAAVKVLKQNPDFYILLQGGYNFVVRYSEQQLTKADFSFSAFSKARREESEANCGRRFLIDHGVDENQIMIEEISATSGENVKIAAILLDRTTFSEVTEVKILSLAYHLKTIFPLYEKSLGLKFETAPLFAEKFLPRKEVEDYYLLPKGGKMWNVQEILDNS